MVPLVPNSFGARLREFNSCHEPAGKATGGRFCSGESREVTRVGITTARTKDDATHYRSNKSVAHEMRGLEGTLRRLPGVRAVSVKPALGQWAGGSEFSFAVSYIGNGEARKLLAQTGKAWNQDAVLILRRPKAGETPDGASEIMFDRPVGMAARTALADYMGSIGLGGWTWYKRNGQTTLRIVSVPQWGGSPEAHRTALDTLTGKLRSQGLGVRERKLRVKTEIYSREGGDGQESYDAVLTKTVKPVAPKTGLRDRLKANSRRARAKRLGAAVPL